MSFNPHQWYIMGLMNNNSIASYSGISYLYSAYGQGRGITFKPDGTEMYLILHNTDVIRRFTLSTPWNVSTATYISNSINVGGSSAVAHGVHISPDGLNFYVGDWAFAIRMYTASTAWNSATLTYTGKIITGAGADVSFNNDGLYMFAKTNSSTFSRYTLSVAWDISTAVISQNLTGEDNGQQVGHCFSPDGTKFYDTITSTNRIRLRRLSVAWDLSSISKTTTLDISSQVIGTLYDVAISSDGTKLFPISYTSGDNNRVKQINLSIPFLFENQTL